MKNKTQWILGGLAVLLAAIVGVYFANPSLQQGKVFKLPIVRFPDFEIIRTPDGQDIFGSTENILESNIIFRDKNNVYDPTQPGGPQPKVKLSRLLWITPNPNTDSSDLPPNFSTGTFTGGPFPYEVDAVPFRDRSRGETFWRVGRDSTTQILAATRVENMDSVYAGLQGYNYQLEAIFGFKVGSKIACGIIRYTPPHFPTPTNPYDPPQPLGIYRVYPIERPLCNQLVFDR